MRNHSNSASKVAFAIYSESRTTKLKYTPISALHVRTVSPSIPVTCRWHNAGIKHNSKNSGG